MSFPVKGKKKPKWATLDERGFLLFKDKKATTPEDEIPFFTLRVEDRKDMKFPCFVVRGSGKELLINSDVDDEHKKWFQVLTEVQTNLMARTPFRGPVRVVQPIDDLLLTDYV